MGSPANITNRSNAPFRVPGGLGEQPSITDRDLGDESRTTIAGQFTVAGPLNIAGIWESERKQAWEATWRGAAEKDAARITALETQVAFWRGNYENMKRMRDALLAPEDRPKPNPLANALTHGWATARYPTERDDLR